MKERAWERYKDDSICSVLSVTIDDCPGVIEDEADDGERERGRVGREAGEESRGVAGAVDGFLYCCCGGDGGDSRYIEGV